MNIYQDRTPYTYLIGWTKLNTWYYGRRTKRGCHPNELWVKYFTSSVEVAAFRRIHGEPDIVLVRKIFTGNDATIRCSKHEVTVIRRMGAVHSTNWLNKGNAGAEFDTTGKVIAKDIVTGNVVVVDQNKFITDSWVVGINSGVKFRNSECNYCGTSISINNIDRHHLYCRVNPDCLEHPRTGISLTESVKLSMSVNHADVSGIKNPSAKRWKLTSPIGEEVLIHGNLDSVLQERELSRFNLLTYSGQTVPANNNSRTSLSKRTEGWKLERL